MYRKLHTAYSGIDDSLFINNSRGFELTGKGDDYDSNGDPIYSIGKAWRTTEEGKRLIYLYEYEQKKLERITGKDFTTWAVAIACTLLTIFLSRFL